MTAGRHIVLEAVAGEYLDQLAKRAQNLPVGNPHTEQVALGPLINERQLANVDRIVAETVAAGATVRAGGTHEQLYYRPTVLADVTPAMAAFREEIFGPVAPVVVVKDVDEAVRVANATEYGLVAAIQTGSMERGLEIADRLNTGIVHVNDQTLNNDAYAPFGGTGASGNGSRFGTQSSWDEFTQWQWVTARPQAHGFPF
jgi:benzaldehyde dehydrogenase (NAD)